MPTDKVKNVLRSFGEGADVILQDSLSKAVRPAGSFDIGDGELVEVTTTGGTGSAPNPLDRTPIGAIVVQYPDATARKVAVVASENDVQLGHDGADGSDPDFGGRSNPLPVLGNWRIIHPLKIKPGRRRNRPAGSTIAGF